MAEVPNPRRVLAVSLAESTQHLSRVIKDLTGAVPEPASTSLAGTTHLLDIKTSYYTAQVPIWLDLITSPAEWSASFLSTEAKEVLSVLGGLAVVFALPPPSSTTTSAAAAAPSSPQPAAAAAAPTPPPPPTADETRALISEVGKVVREGLGGWAWDGVGLGIGIGEGDAEEWEELCAEWGLEFVQVRGGKKDDGRNEFGEKMGIPRVLEALESNDWADDAGPDVDSDLEDVEAEMAGLPRKPRPLADGDGGDDDFDPESLDFGFDRADFEGLKKAIWNLEQEQQQQADDDDEGKDDGKKKDGEGSKDVTKKEAAAAAVVDEEEEDRLGAEDIEKLEGMMRKLQAVRDITAGLPLDQARKMAKKAVAEVVEEFENL